MTLPASDSYDTYGGNIKDYSMLQDASTQWSAEESNPMRASAAAMTNTAFRAIVTYHLDGYNVPQLDSIQAVWNVAGSVLPTLILFSTGVVSIAFPSTVIDLQGNTQSLNMLGAISNININNSGTGYFTNVSTIDNLTFYVNTWSLASGTTVNLTAPVTVFIR